MDFKRIVAFFAALLIVFGVFMSGGIEAYAAIEPGTKSSDVTEMQKKLIALGYLNDSADGSYGPATKTAVKSFESAQGLTADGKADDKMLAKLSDIYTYTPSITFNSNSVNVRKGAGTSYGTLGTLNKGATYKVLGTSVVSGNTWYKFAYKETTAWVLGTYVDISYGSSGKTGTLTNNSINARTGAGTSYSVYKVLSKGYSFKITGQKTVSGTTWYSFIYSGRTLWVSGAYVSLSGGTEATSSTTKSTTASTTASTTESTTSSTTASTTNSTESNDDVQYETIKKGTITGSTVNVRKGAGTNYAVVTTLKKNAVITITGSKTVSGKTWYSYIRSGATVWVCGDYVKVTTTTVPVTTTTKATTTSSTTKSTTESTTSSTTASTTKSTESNDVQYETIKKGTITGSSVNVRKGAGTNYSIVTTIKKDAVITITGSKTVSGKTWYSYIRNGATVWVCGDYVKVTTTTVPVTTTTQSTTKPTSSIVTSPTDIPASDTDATTSTTSTTESTTSSTAPEDDDSDYLYGKVNVNTSLNVRKTASSSATKLGALSNNDFVVIVDYTTKSGWYKIIYGSGYGWVSSEYVKLVDKSEYESDVAFTKDYYYVDLGKTKNIAIAGINGETYISSDPEKLSISSAGVVTGKEPGMYTVTVKFGSSVATTEVVVLREKYTLTDEQKNMGISENGVKFIADWEGGGSTNPDILNGSVIVFEPYKDASGYWTIGYGHAVTTTASKSWSKATAIEYFAGQIEKYFGEEIILSEEKPYLTKEEAQKLLMADLNQGTYVKAVREWAVRNGVVLTQNEFDALVSFTFNLGTSYWTSDTKRFYLKSAIIATRKGSDADPEQVTEGFSRYIRSGSKYLKGLYYRRMNEAEMFTDGDYGIERANKFPLPSGITWS